MLQAATFVISVSAAHPLLSSCSSQTFHSPTFSSPAFSVGVVFFGVCIPMPVSLFYEEVYYCWSTLGWIIHFVKQIVLLWPTPSCFSANAFPWIILCPFVLHNSVSLPSISLLSVCLLLFQVLDEADRMLDMGFEPQIRKIIEQIRVCWATSCSQAL